MNQVQKQSGPRVLLYRGQVRWAGRFSKWSGILLLGWALFIAGATYFNTKDISKTFFLSLPFFFFGLIFSAQYWWKLRPMILARIRVLNDRIDIQRGDRHELILFEEIRAVKSRLLGKSAGWFTVIMKSGKSFRFTIILERAEYLLEGIYKSRPDLMSPEAYQKLRDSLVLADHYSARFYDLFRGKNWITLCLKLFGIPFVGAWIAYSIQPQDLVIHHLRSYILGLTCWGCIVAIYAQVFAIILINSKGNKAVKQQLKIEPLNKRRDLKSETRWMKKWFPIETAATLATLLIITQTNVTRIRSLTALHSAPNLHINSGETLWLDERYNCLECKYSLKKGDILSVDGTPHPVGVVALPGESTRVNISDGKQHFVVAQDLVVPPNKIAVQVWEMGRPITTVIKISDVEGLITRQAPSTLRPSSMTLGPSTAWIPAQQSLALVEGCDPTTLADIKNTIHQLALSVDPLLKARNYTAGYTGLNLGVESILKKAQNCPGISSDLIAIQQPEDKSKNKNDQAWMIRYAIHEISKTIAQKLETSSQVDPFFEQTQAKLSSLIPQASSTRTTASVKGTSR